MGDVREWFTPQEGGNQAQEGLFTSRKRPCPTAPNDRRTLPIGPIQRVMEQAIIGHLATANSAIYAELNETKAYIASLIEGLEQRLMGQLQALERRIDAYEAAQAHQGPWDQSAESLAPQVGPQGLGLSPPWQEVTFTEAAHGAPAKPNGGAKLAESRRAAPPISKPLPRTQPATLGAGKPREAPRWATIAATNAEGWQTVTKRHRTPAKKPSEAPSPRSLKPIRSSSKDHRRLIFRREDGPNAPKRDRADVILALNRCLAEAGFPGFARVVDANYTASGAISALLDQGMTAEALIPAHKDPLVAACHRVDPAVIGVEPNQQWYRVKVHAVPVARYSVLGLGLAREEIELGGAYTLMRDPTWIKRLEAIQAANQRFSTIIVTVGGLDDARRLLANGVRFGGTRHPTSPYQEVGRDSVCTRCCGIGHKAYRACGTRPPLCIVCAGPHEARDHACNVTDCKAQAGQPCPHAPSKCGNCGGGHQASSPRCPKIRETNKKAYKRQPRIEVVIPPLPAEWGTQGGLTSPLELPRTQETQAVAESTEDPMDTEQATSPMPYTSPCPGPRPGIAHHINADYSA